MCCCSVHTITCTSREELQDASNHVFQWLLTFTRRHCVAAEPGTHPCSSNPSTTHYSLTLQTQTELTKLSRHKLKQHLHTVQTCTRQLQKAGTISSTQAAARPQQTLAPITLIRKTQNSKKAEQLKYMPMHP